jgi:hypothetical protein
MATKFIFVFIFQGFLFNLINYQQEIKDYHINQFENSEFCL